jgi:hypothetical protein
VFDQNHFSPDSGFEANFEFEIYDHNELNNIELAIECPERYEVFLNGKKVSFLKGIRWLDPHLAKVRIQNLVRNGRNEVKIVGHPFDVRMELENIYILGDFQLIPEGRGFSIRGQKGSWRFESWVKQGYPFYSGIARYETEITFQGEEKNVSIRLGEWQGSLVEVLVDGKSSALLAWPPYETNVEVGSPGKHLLALRVVSTPRNLFGPFHHPSKLRMRAWPAAWSEFPEHQPAGSEYDFIDFGLLSQPEITVF